MKKILGILLALLLLFLAVNYSLERNSLNLQKSTVDLHEKKPRVLYVNSYHRGYAWSDGITEGILKEFNVRQAPDGSLDQTRASVDLKIVYMDCKRNQSEDFIGNAAQEAKGVIDSWNPDLVITSDDIAAKYLVSRYFQELSIPFVFCGVNYDASQYGFTPDKITGIIEVSLVDRLVDMLGEFSEGKRLGMLGANVLSNRKHVDALQRLDTNLKTYLVETKAEWKESFLKLQKEVDIALLAYSQSIEGWSFEEAELFVLENVSIPWGTWRADPLPNVLLSVSKDPTEQGEWAAQSAKRILKGTSPADIPIAVNQRAKLQLNMEMAKRLGVVFPTEWLQQADLYSHAKKRILFINSYHSGYSWSDGIEQGVCKGLDISSCSMGVESAQNLDYNLRFLRMNTKNVVEEAAIRKVVDEALAIINDWQPEVIIAADDNAVKYLVSPYLKDSKIPVLFCGVNWDASEYGVPTDMVRGMVEVDPVDAVIDTLEKYAAGTRVGFLGVDRLSNHKTLEGYKEVLGLEFERIFFAESFEQWKKFYAELQDQVDIIFLASAVGVSGWDGELATEYVEEIMRVPTGTTLEPMMGMSVLGIVRVPEEQGWWAAMRAKEIVSGSATITEVVNTVNKNNRTLINIGLAAKIGLNFPPEFVREATVYDRGDND